MSDEVLNALTPQTLLLIPEFQLQSRANNKILFLQVLQCRTRALGEQTYSIKMVRTKMVTFFVNEQIKTLKDGNNSSTAKFETQQNCGKMQASGDNF